MSNNRNTYTVRVRRVAADGSTAATRGRTTSAGGMTTDYSPAINGLATRVEALEQLWQLDTDNPGCIVTPYSAYSRAGISALGLAPEISGGGDEGSTASVSIYTDWSREPAATDVLAATLGMELRTAAATAYSRATEADSEARTGRAVDHVRASAGAGRLVRGMISPASVPGTIYRNLGRVMWRAPKDGPSLLNLELYFSTDALDSLTFECIGGTAERTGNMIRITPQPNTQALLYIILNDSHGRYIRRNAATGIIETDSGDWLPDAPAAVPTPSPEELLSIAGTRDTRTLYGYELERLRSVWQWHDGTRHCRRKWVRPLRVKKLGVYRVRRRTRSGRCSLWVYFAMSRDMKMKLI